MNHRTRNAIRNHTHSSYFGRDITNLPQHSCAKPTPIQQSIYSQQIFHSLNHLSMDIQHPTINQHISIDIRYILMEWIIQVHHKFKFHPDTLFLTIYIIDMYSTKQYIKKSQYQLVGFTALFIAAKYQEIDTPSVKQFIQLVDKLYSVDEMVKMEETILCQLEFNLLYISPLWYLTHFAYVLNMPASLTNNCCYLMELSLLHSNSQTYQPIYLAIAAILINNQAIINLNNIIPNINKTQLANSKQFIQDILSNKSISTSLTHKYQLTNSK